jgi:hypothetical protein
MCESEITQATFNNYAVCAELEGKTGTGATPAVKHSLRKDGTARRRKSGCRKTHISEVGTRRQPRDVERTCQKAIDNRDEGRLSKAVRAKDER